MCRLDVLEIRFVTRANDVRVISIKLAEKSRRIDQAAAVTNADINTTDIDFDIDAELSIGCRSL
jgi:hypothetical protein